MDRLNAYTTPTQSGGVTVDIEGALVDVVTVCKASGCDRAAFMAMVGEIFDAVRVEIVVPHGAKN